MNKILLTCFCMSFTFLMTVLGASFVFFFKNKISQKTNAVFSGFSAGIMVAASIWSLLLPAIAESEHLNSLRFLPAAAGFVVGCAFMVLTDIFISKFSKHPLEKNEKKSAKLIFAVTLHNIPEGLAVGFALGAAAAIKTDVSWISAFGLAIGIGIQNIPEGTAVALPVQQSTMSRKKGFFAGALSGAVEPVFAIIGYFLASLLTSLQPWLLAFSAGAMIFVVIEELIPDSNLDDSHIGSFMFVVGFILMMILDIML